MSDHTDTYCMTHVTAKNGEVRMAGQVVRSNDFNAFSDAVILGFTRQDKYGTVYVKLSRPYCSVICVGTTSPGVALMHETYCVSLESLMLMKLIEAMGHRVLGGQTVTADRPYTDEKIDLQDVQS